MTLEQRGPADLVLALALVHHLAIGNNVPLGGIADYFARARAPRDRRVRADEPTPMVQHDAGRRGTTCSTRYIAEAFERAFAARFHIDDAPSLAPSERVLYLMTAR